MKIRLIHVMLILLFLPVLVFGGNVDVTTGSHTQDFDLFEVGSPNLPPTFTIIYESRSPYQGPMGKKWTHTFDLYLDDDGDSMLQKDLFGDQYLYVLEKGKYVAKGGDRSTLVKEANGTFVIKRDGLTYRYDRNRHLTTLIDRTDAKTSFVFSNGKLAKVVTPRNKSITFTYGDGGRLTRVTAPDGKSYALGYNEVTLTSITYPDGGAWRFTYDPKAYMLTKTDPEGHTVTYAYDGKYRVIRGTNHLGQSQTLSYPDSNDQVRTTSMNDNGKITDYTYDMHTRTLNQQVDPDGGVTTYTHDEAGNVTSETDQSGRTTTYTYDDKKRMTSSRDPDGNVTTYRYDAAGKLISVAGPDGSTFQVPPEVQDGARQ
uniref:RHS repeat protein n=1 Tax=Geobacter metallireducens TaxID=28232 RepID=A0A831UJS6_GEOME